MTRFVTEVTISAKSFVTLSVEVLNDQGCTFHQLLLILLLISVFFGGLITIANWHFAGFV